MKEAVGTSEVMAELEGELAVIRFNRLATRNSLSHDTLTTLNSVVSSIIVRPDLRAVILTGTANVFAAGADLRELAQLDPTKARVFSERGQRIFQRIADAPQLTIAAINGFCMGGALDLALACDIRVASTEAVFAHPGAGLGIITGWGGTQRLPRLIGRARASELFFTARRFSASEALEMGLVTELADPVLDHAKRLGLKTRKR
jgi:enoyl-CoA hydratase